MGDPLVGKEVEMIINTYAVLMSAISFICRDYKTNVLKLLSVWNIIYKYLSHRKHTDFNIFPNKKRMCVKIITNMCINYYKYWKDLLPRCSYFSSGFFF